MSTRGFEFGYMLDGSNKTPVIRDLPVHGTGAYDIGDLVKVNGSADGEVARVTTTTTEVTGVMQEARLASVGADADKMKVAIITRNQVWRCSTTAASGTSVIGVRKTLDTTDHNTINDVSEEVGAMILVDNTTTDDDGYLVYHVVFADTTFGNT